MIKALMIEDDLELAQILYEYLLGFEIDVTNYEEPFMGVSALRNGKFDILILDLTLPGMDGLDVCKKVVKELDIPIIISSARSDLDDKVKGLEYGADDYLPKPYNPKELVARINTVIRRYKKRDAQKSGAKPQKEFEFEDSKREITHNKQAIDLTAAEYEIFLHLLKKEGFVISRDELMDASPSIEPDSGQKVIDVIISRIRHKIGDDAKEPKYLFSVRGYGYKFVQ